MFKKPLISTSHQSAPQKCRAMIRIFGCLISLSFIFLNAYYFLFKINNVIPPRTFGYKNEYLNSYLKVRNYLETNALSSENLLFHDLTDNLDFSSNSVNVIGSIILNLKLLVVYLSFVFVVSWRFWALGLLLGVAVGVRKSKTGFDILKSLGNGRLFFSGIYIGKEHFCNNVPVLHVPSLLSLNKEKRKASKLKSICFEFLSLTSSNEELIDYIYTYSGYPAFLNSRFTLLSFAEVTLLVTLFLQKSLKEKKPLNITELKAYLVEHQLNEKYGAVLYRYILRAIYPHFTSGFISLQPKRLSSICLSVAAGRVLAFDSKDGAFYKVTRFPELSARAVFNSLDLSDFSFYEKEDVRRSIIYANRKSTFTDNRFPRNLSCEVFVGRQIAELLFTEPQFLKAKARELELLKLIYFLYCNFKVKLLAQFKNLLGKFYLCGDCVCLSIVEVLRIVKSILKERDVFRFILLLNCKEIRESLNVLDDCLVNHYNLKRKTFNLWLTSSVSLSYFSLISFKLYLCSISENKEFIKLGLMVAFRSDRLSEILGGDFSLMQATRFRTTTDINEYKSWFT